MINDFLEDMHATYHVAVELLDLNPNWYSSDISFELIKARKSDSNILVIEFDKAIAL